MTSTTESSEPTLKDLHESGKPVCFFCLNDRPTDVGSLVCGVTYTMTGSDVAYDETEHHFCPGHKDEVKNLLEGTIDLSTRNPTRTGLMVSMAPGQTEPPTEAEYWEQVRNSAVEGTSIWASGAFKRQTIAE